MPDVEVFPVQTNIVLFRVTGQEFSPESFVAAAHRAGLAISGFGRGRIRAVTHGGVTAAEIDQALGIVERILAAGPRGGTATVPHLPLTQQGARA
jgi:threonine aldolase